MSPIVAIPARLASTRLPDKPLADVLGQPMIVHVWRRAMEADVGPVLVACAEASIAEAVEAAGGRAVLTRPDHPSGSDRIWEAVQEFDPEGRHDVVVNLQGDLPNLDPAAVHAVLAPLSAPEVDIATLAVLIEDPAERADPSVVKALADFSAGRTARADDFLRELPPDLAGRPAYHHIGIYAYRRAALERFVGLPPSEREKARKLEQMRALDAGMQIDVALVDSVPLGVDTPADLARIRELMAPSAGRLPARSGR